MAGLGRIMPKVSVVIPNYNHARFLRQRIDSVMQQTFQDFEVILLDDFSTDGSRSILCEYADDPRVRIEFNEKNSGSTFRQWNRGIALARGEFAWIAESDDYADKRLLEKLVPILDSDKRAVLAYCRSWRVSADNEIFGYLDSCLSDLDPRRWTADFWADGREECRNYLVGRNTVLNASSVVFRREVYQQVGGADESLVYCGDWKTWAAMALTGGRIVYVGETLNFYRIHDMSVSAKSQRLGVEPVEYLRVIRWILQKITPTEATRKQVCENIFHLWGPVVLSSRISLSRRWAILQDARAIDPRALRRLLTGFASISAPIVLMRSMVRIRFWHPVLNATRPVRHALGLRQAKDSSRVTR
jgi:glycosyltransferase involved in cell wall biosynthesis